MTKQKCKDCSPESTRPAVHPGPRCWTHHKEKLKRDEDRERDRRYRNLYGITLEIYNQIYEFQNGYCAICQRANGSTKKLAVDHSHVTGDVRGLCCGPCNKMLGQARDNPEFFDRAGEYLRDPPYKRMREQSNEQ